MKIPFDPLKLGLPAAETNEFTLPKGIVGFNDYTRAELLRSGDHEPFLRMRLFGPTGCINFVVCEPCGVIPGYEPELFDNDAACLGLRDPSEAMVLVILTMRPGTPEEATVNLIGPIVVNRRTQVGRQLVIANHSAYRARHPLIASQTAGSGST